MDQRWITFDKVFSVYCGSPLTVVAVAVGICNGVFHGGVGNGVVVTVHFQRSSFWYRRLPKRIMLAGGPLAAQITRAKRPRERRFITTFSPTPPTPLRPHPHPHPHPHPSHPHPHPHLRPPYPHPLSSSTPPLSTTTTTTTSTITTPTLTITTPTLLHCL
uniref:Uncharacterized protein n=1 Tax=Vespula pensylvanica TaxID=30213 RepID=A0A834MYT1_VESPE|nr:hypothetical protein H0235_018009 [Vespula pensylvanica]